MENIQDVRIIHIKTGEIKYVAPQIANNEKLLKSYGYIKQDLGADINPLIAEKIKEEGPVKIYNTNIEVVAKYEDLDSEFVGDRLSESDARIEYEKIFGKKAGNKKLENILKEIQESKTIQ